MSNAPKPEVIDEAAVAERRSAAQHHLRQYLEAFPELLDVARGMFAGLIEMSSVVTDRQEFERLVEEDFTSTARKAEHYQFALEIAIGMQEAMDEGRWPMGEREVLRDIGRKLFEKARDEAVAKDPRYRRLEEKIQGRKA